MEELTVMSWAKIDDRANEHKKQLKAGAEACWMWTCGLMYANRQDARDGFIPEEALFMLYRFSNPEQLAAKLVEVGLWDVVEGGWKVHNFHKWNLSKEQRDLELAAGRERAAKSYAKKKKSSTEEASDSTGEENMKKNVSSGSGVEGIYSSSSFETGDSRSEAIKVFEAWKTDTGHTSAVFDQKREARIKARLAQGFTVEQLIKAIKNRKNDPWLMGVTSDRVYDGIETLFRDAAQVERLIALDFHRPGLPGVTKKDTFQRDDKGRIQIK